MSTQLDPSVLLRFATRAFGSQYPMRLTFGLALGIATKILIHVVTRTSPDILTFGALDDWAMGYYMFVAAVLMFVPIIFFKKNSLPESTNQQIEIIDALLDKQGASKAQRALTWQSLVGTYLKKVNSDLSAGPKLVELFEEIPKENSDRSASREA